MGVVIGISLCVVNAVDFGIDLKRAAELDRKIKSRLTTLESRGLLLPWGQPEEE